MRSICVFCGSNPGSSPAYIEATRSLAEVLVARGMRVVYGGAHVGTMGALADAALRAGGEVVGVIPQSLVDAEVAHQGLSELRIVGSMHERKALMAELADGFVALPGGLGTLEELAEVATWSQLGLHDKPVGLLDVRQFWQPLIDLLDHAVTEQFLRIENRHIILREEDPDALLDAMADWRPARVPKWIPAEANP